MLDAFCTAAARFAESQPAGTPGVYILLALAAFALCCAPKEE